MGTKPLVFLSWSGKKSQAVAKVFHDWIRRFIQDCEPWMSSEDIDIGKPWREELNKLLDPSRKSVGIFVLTKQNVLRPWVLFEYGRLSARENSLCPPLCCDFRPADITGPLGELQGAVADKGGILSMFKSIDRHLGTGVGEALLTETYDSQWERFEPVLSAALGTEDAEGDAPVARDTRDMVEEILERVRAAAKLTVAVETLSERLGPSGVSRFAGKMQSGRAEVFEPLYPMVKAEYSDVNQDFLSVIMRGLKLPPGVRVSSVQRIDDGNYIVRLSDGTAQMLAAVGAESVSDATSREDVDPAKD